MGAKKNEKFVEMTERSHEATSIRRKWKDSGKERVHPGNRLDSPLAQLQTKEIKVGIQNAEHKEGSSRSAFCMPASISFARMYQFQGLLAWCVLGGPHRQSLMGSVSLQGWDS